MEAFRSIVAPGGLSHNETNTTVKFSHVAEHLHAPPPRLHLHMDIMHIIACAAHSRR